MPSHLHLAYRRNAKAAAANHRLRKSDQEELFEKARNDFGFFCEYVADKPPAEHHKHWHQQLVTNEDSSCLTKIAGPNIDLLGPRGPLAVSMPVATPQGWVPIGDLQINDLVFSEKGTITEVVGISDYEESPTWKITFSDGSTVRCDDQHRWKVRRMGSDPKGTWRVMSLNEIRTQKTIGMKGNGRGSSPTRRITETCAEGEKPWLDSRNYPRYKIPVTEPVEYPETTLPLDPYLLGALIGDGSLSSRNLSLTTADQEIVDRCSLHLPVDYCFKKLGKYRYNISNKKGVLAKGVRNPVKQILIDLRLYGKTAAYKFIPSQYLHASIQDREALLQGLLDTDGTVSSGGSVSFCSTSLPLVYDVIELVQSLGGIATLQKPQLNSYTNADGIRIKTQIHSYRVGIKLHSSIKPFHLKRKAERYSPCFKYPPCRSIVNIEPAEKERVRCIEVADESHTFLTKDYICSPNSAKSTVLGLYTAWAIGVHTLAKKPLQILYLSYTVDIARSKSATIKRIIESKKYQNVFPTVKLLKNVTSNEYWSIDHKFAGIDTVGEEQFTLCAAGLKGSVTSKRSHLCLTGDTLVYTDQGQVPIAAIYENPGAYNVATRNHSTDQIDWCKVGAVTRRRTKGIVEITTASGNNISATPEHPFITSEGRQKRAGDLSKGDTLVKLSGILEDQILPCVWKSKEKNSTDLRELSQNHSVISGEFNLPGLQSKVFFNVKPFISIPKQKSSSYTLQSQMCGDIQSNSFDTKVPVLSRGIQTDKPFNQVLFTEVCRQTSFKQNEGMWEQQLSTRLFNKQFQKPTSSDYAKGQFYLRRLWYKGEETEVKRWVPANQSLCSSYRSQKDKQYPSKFNNIMSSVPCGTSSNNGQSWKAESISRVEFFSDREEYVYDLEVEHESHNFIANGLNVANCIIDDPVKSAADIGNPDIRKMMQDNWNAVIAPTMFEGGRAICLGTRFRHDDIHATTFCPQNNWMQIVLSAILNNEETGEEESYWPDMWSLDYLKEKKRQAPIAFSFQYMNQIVRQNELSLAPELLVKAEIATEFDCLGVGVDLSAGVKEKNDYTVMVLGGRIGNKIHIIDYRRLRVMGNLEKLDAMKELLNDWSIIGKQSDGLYFPTYSTCDIWSEAVQYQASLEADFKRVCLEQEDLYNLIWHPVKGFRSDKLARFRGIMGMFEDRKIIFNRYRNFTTMFEELTNFGVSSHDDCVDALVWLVTGLMKRGKLQLDY